MIILAAIFVYCLAALFKLLDTSASLLIKNGISVTPFYLKRSTVKKHLANIKDRSVKRKLRLTLVCQTLHTVFAVAAILTFIVGIIYECYNPYLIHLF